MNIARLFSYTLAIEAELARERTLHARTREEARQERQTLIDAYITATGRKPVYAALPPPEHPLLNKPAFGPTATAARELEKDLQKERNQREPTEQEIEAAAEKIRASAVDAPPTRSNGDAEPAVPIEPGERT